MNKDELKKVHKMSGDNKNLILSSEKCGCFHCKKIFESIEVEEFGSTHLDDPKLFGICPKCGMDSLIPDNSEWELNEELLKKMYEVYFKDIDNILNSFE